ncbi:MAG: helix-turn-helix domain-containing protein [Dehalococcoidia bacterium]
MASIKELRRRRGLSQRRLAILAHVSIMTISRAEAGQGRPSPSTVYAIAKVLGVDTEEIDVPLPTHIERLQAKKGLADGMLCRKAGIQMPSLRHLRSPRSRHDATTAMKVAEALEVSAAEILGLHETNMNELKRLRLAKRLTVSELSRRSGISRQTIYNLEDGHYHPSEDTVRKLATVLDRAPGNRTNP